MTHRPTRPTTRRPRRRRGALLAAPVVALAMAAGSTAVDALPAGALRPATTMVSTLRGTVVRVVSMHAFTMAVKRHDYRVTVDAMTHVTLDRRRSSVERLRRGDTVTVRGRVDMRSVTASAVVASS